MTLGRYEIRSQLGAGGMGEVYLAQDTRLGRKVAIKILPDEVAADPDRMRRFEREARSASGLNHPNIITIYDIDQVGGIPFIAAEFIEGSTLRERMRAQRLSRAEALDLAVQIASALTAAHANGIVHRDIKPENIIVRADGIAKVLDFGLAKLDGPHGVGPTDPEARTETGLETEPGLVVGTAAYMSPEQARGQLVDARTDIFSLGAVMYEMLAARSPFEGSSTFEIVASILSDRESPLLSRHAPETPAELDRIVSKTLRKRRDERYQTVADLLLDLQSLERQLAFERTHQAGPVRGAATPRTKWAPTRRTQILGALGLLLFGGVILYAWWARARASHEPEITSLAVLPLKSLDAGDSYLGLGIADAAIGRVSETGKLIVRPTSAVRRYLTENTDALVAAKQLGVDSVLEGSFQRAGDRLRVRVNLLRTRDGASLWTESFDLRMGDIFAVQDTVAQQVASRLRLQLDESQRAQLTRRYTSSPIAYEFYLKGAVAFDQRLATGAALPSIKNAIDLLTRAIEADPNFAVAHAQLAYVYARRAVFIEPTQPAWLERAKKEITRADELDPRLAETHLARFQLLYSEFEGYQGDAAVRELKLANRLNPSVGHGELAYMYTHLGLEDLAARESARSYEIDPTSDTNRQTTMLMYEVQSRYDEYAADRSVTREGRSEVWYLIGKGRLGEAQTALDIWAAKQPNHIALPPTKALLLARKGDFRAAEAQIPITLSKHPLKDPLYHHAAYDIACVYALEGKSHEAVKWLREAATTGYHLYPRYLRDANLDQIRHASEFIQFLSEMKAENDRYRRELS